MDTQLMMLHTKTYPTSILPRDACKSEGRYFPTNSYVKLGTSCHDFPETGYLLLFTLDRVCEK